MNEQNYVILIALRCKDLIALPVWGHASNNVILTMTFVFLHIVRNLYQQAHSAKTSRDNGDHKTNRFVRDSPLSPWWNQHSLEPWPHARWRGGAKWGREGGIDLGCSQELAQHQHQQVHRGADHVPQSVLRLSRLCSNSHFLALNLPLLSITPTANCLIKVPKKRRKTQSWNALIIGISFFKYFYGVSE